MSHSLWAYSSFKMISRCSNSKKSLQANRYRNGRKEEMINRHHIVGVDLIISSHFRDPPKHMMKDNSRWGS
jgi:hypothetical protein